MSQNNTEKVYGLKKPFETHFGAAGSQDASFVSAFNAIQKKMNSTAHDKGWYDSVLGALVENESNSFVRKELDGIEDARRIALMHSELSEGLEGLRHGNPPSDHIPEFSAIEEELADVIIRIMDVSQERGWKVAEALIAKAAFNQTRSRRHGGKAF